MSETAIASDMWRDFTMDMIGSGWCFMSDVGETTEEIRTSLLGITVEVVAGPGTFRFRGTRPNGDAITICTDAHPVECLRAFIAAVKACDARQGGDE